MRKTLRYVKYMRSNPRNQKYVHTNLDLDSIKHLMSIDPLLVGYISEEITSQDPKNTLIYRNLIK